MASNKKRNIEDDSEEMDNCVLGLAGRAYMQYIMDEEEAAKEAMDNSDDVRFHKEEPQGSHIYVVIDGAIGWVTCHGEDMDQHACCFMHYYKNRATEISVVIKDEEGEVLERKTLEQCHLMDEEEAVEEEMDNCDAKKASKKRKAVTQEMQAEEQEDQEQDDQEQDEEDSDDIWLRPSVAHSPICL